MTETLLGTNFQFPGQINLYKGKVRDVYELPEHLIIIATDRISAFDVVSSQGIPYKGQVLNQIAKYQLDQTKDIVPNWLTATPDPNVSIGVKCKVFKIEVIIRGYLSGSAWRAYESGERKFGGISVPGGMKQNQKFDAPILTPTNKADVGHDEDISEEEIVSKNLATKEEWQKIKDFAFKLFDRGSKLANKKGLILVDTKYEFGKTASGEIILIDEVHTPDSSRYFYKDQYEMNYKASKPQNQLSKEFVREWLMSQGYKGQSPKWPNMPTEVIQEISNRYIDLYERFTGKDFERFDYTKDITNRIENNILKYLGKAE